MTVEPVRIPIIYEEDTSALVRASTETKNLQKATEDFSAAQKQAFDSSSDAMYDNLVQLKATANAQAQLNKVASLEADLITSKTGSYKALNAELQLNNIRLAQMTLQEQKASKEGQELRARVKELNKELGEFKNSSFSETLKDSIRSINLFGVNIGNVIDSLKQKQILLNGTVSGVKSLSGAFKILKVALASTGIGLIVIALLMPMPDSPTMV